jgi:DNA-binding MarR family transcriptional regulator
MATAFVPGAAPADPADAGAECRQADLGWALGAVFRAYQKLALVAVADLPGGPRGYQVLAAASHDVPGTQLALAQQLGVDRTVMTYLLDDLERAGLITRRPDPADRRARRVVATDSGRELLCTLERRLQAAEDQVLGTFSEAERDLFRTLISRLAVRADQADPAGSACSVAEDLAKMPDPPVRRPRARA